MYYTEFQRLIIYLCLVVNSMLFCEALIFYFITWAQIREAEASHDDFDQFEAIMDNHWLNEKRPLKGAEQS